MPKMQEQFSVSFGTFSRQREKGTRIVIYGRYAHRSPLGHPGRTAWRRARPSRRRAGRRHDRRRASDRSGAREIYKRQTYRFIGTRADSGPGQRAHAQSDDADAWPRGRSAVDGLAAAAHLAGRSARHGAGVRARRRRTGDCRNAARWHDLLQRKLFLPRRAGRDLPASRFSRRRRPAVHRVSERLGAQPR